MLAVTTQHMCGMGGDLFALVHARRTAPPAALAAAGRAGSGADAAAMRAEGLTAMPMRGDVRSATVPGCVDGWLALHERFGRLPLADVLAPARDYADDGFPGLAAAGPGRRADRATSPAPTTTCRPAACGRATGCAGRWWPPRWTRSSATGRDGFYGGAFGAACSRSGGGLFAAEDLARSLAEWDEPLRVDGVGPRDLDGAAAVAGLPDAGRRLDRRRARRCPTIRTTPPGRTCSSEAARWAGHDRDAVLFDGADGAALLDRRAARRRGGPRSTRRAAPAPPCAAAAGGTIYLCAVDGDGMGVSLIQSNAAGWGCHLVVPGTGIFLQNRGIGFTLEPGHPAELGAGPAAAAHPRAGARHPRRRLVAVLGTQGGDIQPQVVLQLLARMLRNGRSPGQAVRRRAGPSATAASRPGPGGGPQVTTLESTAPPSWETGWPQRGHRVVRAPSPDSTSGHAQVIVRARRRHARRGCGPPGDDRGRDRLVAARRDPGSVQLDHRAGQPGALRGPGETVRGKAFRRRRQIRFGSTGPDGLREGADQPLVAASVSVIGAGPPEVGTSIKALLAGAEVGQPDRGAIPLETSVRAEDPCPAEHVGRTRPW